MRAILMFHGVDATGSVLSVSGRQLGSLVESILRSGHRVVPLHELLRQPNEDALVALTFDDGFASVAEEGAPVLKSLGVSATLFLTTGRVGLDNAWPSQPEDAPRFPMMSWDQVSGLRSAGWDIEAHSSTHPDLRTLSDTRLQEELALPLDDIERHVGTRPRILAYPYGYHDPRVRRAAHLLYESAVTTAFRPLRAEDDAYGLPRLDAYYLRSSVITRAFGGAVGFRTYLELRRLLRRLRRHPGELGMGEDG